MIYLVHVRYKYLLRAVFFTLAQILLHFFYTPGALDIGANVSHQQPVFGFRAAQAKRRLQGGIGFSMLSEK